MAYLNNNGLATQIAAIKAYIQDKVSNFLPVTGGDIIGTLTVNGTDVLPSGAIWAYAGNNMPAGWLLCDGSAVSRTTYADLFSVIGVIYGAGDGETTFNLPDLTDKFIEGSATVGTEKTAGLPDIIGKISPSLGADWQLDDAMQGSNGDINNAFHCTTTPGKSPSASITTVTAWNGFTFDASRSSSIYGNSTTVQPPALTLRYIIKY